MMRSLQIAALGFAVSVLTAIGDQVLPMATNSVGVSFSKDGKSLAVLGGDNNVRVLSLATGKPVFSLGPQPGEVFFFLPAAGNLLATITTNGAGRIHDTKSGRIIANCDLPVSIILGGAMASTVDSAVIAVAGGDPAMPSGNLIQVMDRSGKPRFRVPAGVGGVSSMAFSPDGETLAAAAYDADIRIWDVRTGGLKRGIEALKVAMFDLAWSPDGKYLASAGVDRTIYLWDTQSWKVARKITGQPETINAIRFSPDGKMLVTGGMNERNFNAPTKVILWNFASGRKIRTWTAEHTVRAMSFSPDGKQVAVADGTPSVKLLAVRRKRSTAKW